MPAADDIARTERAAIDAILGFWLEEVGVEGWFRSDPALDAQCAEHCGALAAEAVLGGFRHWQATPPGSLALLILLDQMPRNIHRGTAAAFAADPLARATAKRAIAARQDRNFASPARALFTLPLMHSESLADQDRSVRLTLLAQEGAEISDFDRDNRRSAIEHRATIRRFGRFPTRNAALGRESSEAELAFLATGAAFVKATAEP
ncbi:MAG: DUF924 family protein [Pseudomonadota bacterium]